MTKKDRIKALETELRILRSQVRIALNSSGFHAHHNKRLLRYQAVIAELETISIKWKIKKLLRRIKSLWQK